MTRADRPTPSRPWTGTTLRTLGAAGFAVLSLATLSAALTASADTLSSSRQDPLPEPPPKIVVVGASMSAGFRLERYAGMFGGLEELAPKILGREVSEAELMERSTSIEPATLWTAAWGHEVTTCADTMLFSAPERRARKALTDALATEPDLLLGLDLLFWFGYGNVPGDGPGSATDRASRLALQQKGLDLIDELLSHTEVQLVVGDYPDLSDAVPLMISEKMIPSAEVRAELDQRLRAWAEERARVQVFPLADCLTRLRNGEVVVTLDEEAHTVAYDRAMQFARVHPTKLGTAVVCRELCHWATEHLDAPLWPETTRWEVFVDAAEARDALRGGSFEAMTKKD